VSTAPAVEIRDLVKRYRDNTAVAGLTMHADRGQVTAILGPNGAGKTTTIETCEGYRRADSGSVRVLGLDPVADARELRPKVGVMLQSGGVPTTARASEYLRVMASFYARPLDPARLMAVLGLTGSARTPYKHLSGGQQQRLCLAAGQLTGPAPFQAVEAEPGKPGPGLGERGRPAPSAQQQRQGDVLLRGQLGDELTELEDKAELIAAQLAALGLGAGVQALPGKPDLAVFRHQNAAEAMQQRRLAGPARAHDGEDLALLNRECRAAQGRRLAERLGHGPCLDDDGHRRTSPASTSSLAAV
jgi:ABC-type transport system involved in cytochrome c biogenesis ATPase subunit